MKALILLAIILYQVSHGVLQRPQKQRKPAVLKTTSTTTTTTTTTTPKPFYKFDGVDYFDLPQTLFFKYYDCQGDYLACVRNLMHTYDVCTMTQGGWNFPTYYTICEMYNANCMNRVTGGENLFGQNITDWTATFQAEGRAPSCDEIFRRNLVADALLAVRKKITPFRRINTNKYLKPRDLLT